MKHHEAWFEIFKAAVTGLSGNAVTRTDAIASLARSMADEAMTHLHPGVIDIETGHTAVSKPGADVIEFHSGQAAEDDIHQATRQITPSGPTPAEQPEDDISQATR